MADAAPLDVNLNVVFVKVAAGELEWGERSGGGLRRVTVGLGHE
jgi:hypothetical protein